jgi:hypothetical protein
VVVFAGLIAYQIIFRAIPAFSNTAEPISFVAGMMLISSISFVLAMLLASLAIRRAKSAPESAPESEELPKIKDPKIAAPAREENAPAPQTIEAVSAEPAAETLGAEIPVPEESAAPVEQTSEQSTEQQ